MIKFEILVGTLVCFFLFVEGAAPVSQPVFPPMSKEAKLIESTSAAEVMVSATGIGVGKKKEQTSNALQDARRSALYFVLYGGTDPLLQTPEEKSKFETVANKYFDQGLSMYVSWEADDVERRVSIEGGEKLKITKSFKINKSVLEAALVADEVIKSREDLEKKIGLPMLMVIPKVPMGKSPIDAMNSDPLLAHAAQVIKSYLTARKYEVQVPGQALAVQDQAEGQLMVKSAEEDLSYQLALTIGSDVYITYTIDVQSRSVGGKTVRKAIVSVEAFETTTARLLGTETGYSQERPSADKVVIEEGIKDAVDKVLSRVNAYWKKDTKQGIQYRVVFRIEGDFDEDTLQDIQFALYDIMKEIGNQSKQLVATDVTLEYLIWAKIDQFRESMDIYRTLVERFRSEFREGRLRQVLINRKLIILKVVEG